MKLFTNTKFVNIHLEYPNNCTYYYGPHPVECLVTIWLSVNCLPDGYKYPLKLNDTELDILDNMNLRYKILTLWRVQGIFTFLSLYIFREIISLYNETFNQANNNTLAKQQECFGIGISIFLILLHTIVHSHLLLCQSILMVAFRTMVLTPLIVLRQYGMILCVSPKEICTQRSLIRVSDLIWMTWISGNSLLHGNYGQNLLLSHLVYLCRYAIQ